MLGFLYHLLNYYCILKYVDVDWISEYNSPPVMPSMSLKHRSHLSSRTPSTKTISPANITMENMNCKLNLPPPSYSNFNHIRRYRSVGYQLLLADMITEFTMNDNNYGGLPGKHQQFNRLALALPTNESMNMNSNWKSY